MEIKEIVNCFFNPNSEILDISFRMIDDDDDIIRNDNIEYSIATKYGFNFDISVFDGLFEDSEYLELGINDDVLDESELMSFLAEYYESNPDLLPDPELY